MIGTWPAPTIGGKTTEELLLSFDNGRSVRLLVIPALFDEANKLRRFTAEVMRRLDEAGIDCFLPDLPGMNESLAPLETQTLAFWREAAGAAAHSLAATHVLSMRGGALLAPENLPGFRYAPQTGERQLRSMLRAQLVGSREAGADETSTALAEKGRISGIALAGWSIGPEMYRQLEKADATRTEQYVDISQDMIGGAGLWLRAEPGHDPEQADALAMAILEDLDRPQ